MKIIAIETTTEICGVALFQDGKCVSIVEDNIPKKHAEQLPLFYSQIAAEQTLDLSTVRGIAVSIGPGSFTGLRIGLSYAKGLAYSHKIPIIPVPTLMAHTYCAGKLAGMIKTLLYSHSDKIFAQDFQWINRKLSCRNSAVVRTWSEIATELSGIATILHSGCDRFNSTFADFRKVTPSARYIGELASQYFSEWKVDDPKRLEPDYIAPFIVKRK